MKATTQGTGRSSFPSHNEHSYTSKSHNIARLPAQKDETTAFAAVIDRPRGKKDPIVLKVLAHHANVLDDHSMDDYGPLEQWIEAMDDPWTHLTPRAQHVKSAPKS